MNTKCTLHSVNVDCDLFDLFSCKQNTKLCIEGLEFHLILVDYDGQHILKHPTNMMLIADVRVIRLGWLAGRNAKFLADVDAH